MQMFAAIFVIDFEKTRIHIFTVLFNNQCWLWARGALLPWPSNGCECFLA